MSRAAMRQALEALEVAKRVSNCAYNTGQSSNQWEASIQPAISEFDRLHDKAITALKQALAEHDRLEVIEMLEKEAGIHVSQQAEPEQEPVAKHMHPELRKMWEDHFDRCFKVMFDSIPEGSLPVVNGGIALSPQPEQEPVAWQCREHGDTEWFECSADAVGVNFRRYAYRALYTAPTPRKPLTDEEISSLWDGHVVPVFGKNGINPIVFARAIERAHGIKEQEHE